MTPRTLRNLLFYGIGILIILIIIYYIGIEEVLRVIASTDLKLFLFAVLVYFLTLFVLMLRWKYILNINGFNATLKNLFLLITMGQFINNVTPSMKGGSEPFRAYYLSKLENIPYHITFSTVVIERLLDSVVFLILTSVVIIKLTISGAIYSEAFILAWILILGLTALSLYVLMHRKLALNIVLKVANVMARFSSRTINEDDIKKSIVEFQNSIRFFKNEKKGILISLILSIMWWLLDISRIYILFVAIKSNISLMAVSSTYLMSLLVGILPTLPGGLGTADTVMIAMYSFFKVPSSQAAAGTILDRAISYIMVTIMGAIAFSIIKTSVKRAQ
ncbi:MAG: glycosyltransferase 2 family protein [Methanothermococcus sp.]|jgi:hypothetical protein|uniref:UPF0104 family protein n=1 Tax=Methanothermococcus TaxID=155862 RepID=UPI00036FC800|nr:MULTISPECIES: UPF0104 family protein [Methanothermococcus]MDK2791089.1 glycosyltransferase 2 family protein [Methanothermococcus sp.]MDK2988248.1 glycosyltransferase 2 family protein [Methanothermococcus sp.]